MNRFAKYALRKLQEETFPERDQYITNIYRGMSYSKSLWKQKKGIHEELGKLDAFCCALKYEVELNTINGKLKCYSSEGLDRLEVAEVQMPIPKFYYCDRRNCYKPGFNTYLMNQIIFGYRYKHFKKDVVVAWALVKDHLLQPVRKKDTKLMTPFLEIDSGDHVYFLYDEIDNQIKIGCSKQITTRFRAIHSTYGRTNLQVIKVIDLGGYDLESALHQYFNQHRIKPNGEWFSDHQDIRDFIERLDAGEDPWRIMRELGAA